MCLHRELTESTGPRLSVRPALCPCFCHRIRVCESKSLRTGTPGLLEGKHQLRCGGAPGSRPAGVPASGKQGRCSAWPPPPRGSGLAAASCHTNPAVEPQLSCVLSAWMKLPFSGTLTKPRHPFGKSGVQGRTLHGHDTQRAPAGGLRSDVGSHTPPGGLPGQARERCPRLTGPDRCREVPPWAWSRLARSPEAGRRASTRKDAQEGTPLHASSQASSVSGRLRQTLGGPHYCRLCLCSDKHFLRENHIFSSPRLNLHLSNTQLLEAFRTVTVGSAAFTKGGRGCHGGSSVNAPIIDSRNDSRAQLRAITIITHP
ncbi:uncharacterized protein LOC130543500 [Ursus arctos]|uniref:uncharacterized protein LOC130543500 n=1 Tax=Ursus arctos TaxID=9644 RepID=UPI0025498651|nr:uncharacterized protein LOC130543500 [Ursus arctos]